QPSPARLSFCILISLYRENSGDDQMSLDVLIRQATLDDIPALLRHRRGMYEDMGYNDREQLRAMISTCTPYLAMALANGTLHGWLAQAGDRVVAGGFVLISPWPSHPYDGKCRRATILNMYTDPEFRRQGIARRLMQTMIDWCRKAGFVHVDLHASDKGRPLYESLGFKSTNEMRLKL
ncbi:MAG TPA: GNAT family N-acetyltransferase, partial [Terriglobales bacterium]|nr:GNAT family N-acetyltransferase [Terriglobales bacterium]